MGKPTRDLHNEHYLRESYVFLQRLVETCKDTETLRAVLKELLTPSELRMIKKRWYIARLLQTGMDVRSIAHQAEVSTTTVVRISHVLKRNNSLLKLMLVDSAKTLPLTSLPEGNSGEESERTTELASVGARYVYGEQ